MLRLGGRILSLCGVPTLVVDDETTQDAVSEGKMLIRRERRARQRGERLGKQSFGVSLHTHRCACVCVRVRVRVCPSPVLLGWCSSLQVSFSASAGRLDDAGVTNALDDNGDDGDDGSAGASAAAGACVMCACVYALYDAACPRHR